MNSHSLLFCSVLLLALFSSASSFDSQLNYGCKTGFCSFQLVVPKEVSQWIDEEDLKNQVQQISNNLLQLKVTVGGLNTTDTSANFTQKFDGEYSATLDLVTPVDGQANDVKTSSDGILASAQADNETSLLLYNAIACFQKGIAFSSTCFVAPTTAAPSTVQTTVTGGTQGTDGTTVTGVTGVSTVTGGSTVTGQTQATGGSTATPGSTAAAQTGSTTVVAAESTTVAAAESTTAVNTEAPVGETSTVVPSTEASSTLTTKTPCPEGDTDCK